MYTMKFHIDWTNAIIWALFSICTPTLQFVLICVFDVYFCQIIILIFENGGWEFVKIFLPVQFCVIITK